MVDGLVKTPTGLVHISDLAKQPEAADIAQYDLDNHNDLIGFFKKL